MLKKVLFLLLFSLAGSIGYSQNLPQFTQYVLNPFYFNPGAAGQFNRIQIQSNIRSQYLGYSATEQAGGGNTSGVFSVDMPFQRLKGGIGVMLANQQISNAQHKSEVTLNYAYHKQINSSIVGVGVGLGLNHLVLSGEDYIPRDPDDTYIPTAKLSAMAPDVNFGIYLVNPSYQIGISAKNIFESNYALGNGIKAFREKREYFLQGRYDFPISYTLDLSPMLMLRSDLVVSSIQAGLMATFNDRYWIGGNFRYQDAGGIMAGASILENKLKVGYALDLITFGKNAKATTSHEIYLKYVLAPIKMGKKSIVKTPRYSF